MKIERGFTLAEILVVIAITAIVGTILVLIFTNTLRGSAKAQILSAIKQNGQAVLENMDKTIRNADDVVCVSSNPPNTLVVVRDGVYTRYRIALSSDNAGSAPSACVGRLGIGKNGCIVWDNPTSQGTPQGMCDDPMPSADILTDTDTKTGVSIVSGSFSSSKPAGYNAAVTVEFKLKPGAGAPAVITGQIDPVAFRTTIELR